MKHGCFAVVKIKIALINPGYREKLGDKKELSLVANKLSHEYYHYNEFMFSLYESG